MLADLAERLGHDELRISHEQNVILPHVHASDLPEIYAVLRDNGLATANVGLISDIIACPGMDYCALATARSIPVAQEIATRFDDTAMAEYANVDGVAAFVHGTGCAMDPSGDGYANLQRVLWGYASHPNCGGVLERRPVRMPKQDVA